MTNISELINSKREVTIGDKTLKVRKLKIKEIFGYFEESILDKRLKEAKKIADLLDGDEKKAFLIDVWKKLPKGDELTELVTNAMGSVGGVVDMIYLASRDVNEGIKIEDIRNLIDFENLNEVAPIVQWVMGFETSESEGGDKKK